MSPVMGSNPTLCTEKNTSSVTEISSDYVVGDLQRTKSALEAFSLASFFDFPEPSADISLREALMMKLGAWDGPDVDNSWYWMPGYNSLRMETCLDDREMHTYIY